MNPNKSKKTNPRTPRKTMKRRGGAAIANKTKSSIVQTFLEMLNTVKLYHWRTTSYPEHKATDELYGKLNENIDQFVEVLLGKDASRVRMVERRIRLIDVQNAKTLREKMFEYRVFLIDLSRYFDVKKDSDLLNIRDEMLGNINQFLYLMTFRS